MCLGTLALLVIGLAPQDRAPLVCPMMGEEVTKDSPAVDYNGIRFTFCCSGCDATFMSDPVKALKNEKTKGRTVGLSMFDPVSGKKVLEPKAKGFTDYEKVRYLFVTDENKKAFDADPKKFAVAPKTEALTCPISGKAMTYASADNFVDYNGVRYYTCCPMCTPTLKADPSKFAASVAKAVQKPKAVPVVKQG